MTFASDKGADAVGIRHGGLMGNPAGGRREKAPDAIILSISVIYLAVFIYPVPRINVSKIEAFSVIVLPFEVVKSEGSLLESKPNTNYDIAQLRE
jgi:hypothetical protein